MHGVAEARVAGVLLHPTSLPGIYGTGELGDHAIAFLDWAASAGIRIWQVLPLNPPGYGGSPYGCLSSFAGNPMLVSLQKLLHEGLLDADDVSDVPRFSDERLESVSAAAYKYPLLRMTWRRFRDRASDELRSAHDAFVAAPEQRGWLDDYALFMVLKERSRDAPWWEWDEPLASHDEAALQRIADEQADEIGFWKYTQFLFFRQWAAVRAAARSRGIRIMGDVPIYVAHDSADVWANRDLFHLDERGKPTAVAGVPPDYFSADGQRWGNPLYRWEAMREENFAWWIARVRTNLAFADVVRLDHFRGFAAYWEIPADEPTAIHGRWMPGPGTALFDAIRNAIGHLPLVAEDLGFITDDVHELRKAIDVPGMKVLQFGFASVDSPHLPHRFEPRTVVYTGTHDNDTARGWFDHATDEERDSACAYLGVSSSDDIARAMIRAVYTSVAEIAIVPVQDILGLGSAARMNTPGASEGNWTWRLLPGALTQEHASWLRKLAMYSGRV